MLKDDLRAIYYIALKDLRTYYLKPPNISWGILFPFAFVLAFAIRSPGDLRSLVPGLLALTLLFGTSSMEAIVIVFERRIGALERLVLAPIRLPALLISKIAGGMIFGLVLTLVMLILALLIYGAGAFHWGTTLIALLLSAATFATLGAFVSVAVNEIFEAQTLANFIRFPMMFLGGIFVPVAAMPPWLQAVARLLPLTYCVEALQAAWSGAPGSALGDLGALALFGLLFYAGAVRMLARRIEGA